jgi:probable F420-dependent oxidoreductase
VDVGVSLPTVGPIGEREFLLDIARAADRGGLHSVWATDHVILPKNRTSEYPYKRSTTEMLFSPGVAWLDPVATLGVVAGATERVAIGTAVLVLPYRSPIVLANELASLDRLSEGRIILGVGAGWMNEEFEALGVSPKERGSRTDEYIKALKTLWAAAPDFTSFEGRFVHFEDMALASAPHRPGGPPIYVGGNSPAALRRAGALADGWLGMEIYLDEVADARASLEKATAEAGRDPGAVSIAIRRGVVPPFEVSNMLPARRAITGSAGEVADELRRFGDEGVSFAVLDLAMFPAEAVRTIEWLSADVVPLLA